MLPHLLALPLLAWALIQARELHRRPGLGQLFLAGVGLLGVAMALWLPFAWARHMSMFGLLSLACYGLFVGMPLMALAVARAGRGATRGAALALAAVIVAVGTDAFFVEPRALQTTTVQLRSAEVDAPLRIVLLADLQTDRVGRHEARALAEAAAAHPDLVVFTGDHVQLHDGPAFREQAARHAEAVRAAGLTPRLGAFAVRGDVDPDTWAEVFAGTDVQVLHDSRTLDLGPLTLTALSPWDSRSPTPPVPAVDGLHVVMGHSPDFALARPPADLLLAGHTHGGQVRLPFYGPPITFAAVPRAWAAGHTALPWGGDLVVSRGIGLERQDAPALRFLCRPEVVVIDILPAETLADGR